jgi:anaerobic selenocysteine-containing dehydrogenase
MSETHTTFCRICEALCGLEATVDNGRVASIVPDERHIATQGFACPKGLKQHKIYDSPDRLRYPMKRVGRSWQRVSWEQALLEIGERVQSIRQRLSPDSIAMYVGTAAGFGVLHPMFAQGFMTGVGSKSMYSSATQDCANKFAVSRQLYGFPFTLTFPDLDNVRSLVIVGANPVVSKWSFLQVSNPVKRLRDIQERGGKVWVVDPRRTETAKVADEHVFIRPNTDVFFFLSFLHELIRSGGIEPEKASRWMKGLDALERTAEPWSPERTEPVTGIPAAKLREIVADYRTSGASALYGSTGINMGRHGSSAFWLLEAINAASGNLDRSGGTLVSRGIIDFIRFGKRTGTLLRQDRSRIGDFASVNDAFPGGILADEILTPGAQQVRALFVTGGNPLITMANSERLKSAFQELELLVVLDIFLNETASVAHYALPCTGPLERPDLPFIFPLMLGLQSRPYLQATEAIVEPDGEQRDEATIYLQLARASGVNLFGSAVVQRGLEAAMKLNGLRRRNQPSVPQEALLSLLLRASGQGGFKRLLRDRHGRPRPPHQEHSFLGKRVITDDGLVDLAPSALLAQAQDFEGAFEREQARTDTLKLITKRAVKTHNSWTHNIEEFVANGMDRNYLYMHPDDADRLGLADGALVDVASNTAAVRVPMKLLSDLMPGTVALPHGWGHQHADGLSVASKTKGVNVNILAADGPDGLERLSGMAHLTGIEVSVTAAGGAHDESSWSGLPAA